MVKGIRLANMLQEEWNAITEKVDTIFWREGGEVADSDVLPNDTIYLKLTNETWQLSNEELNPAKLKWFPASQDKKLLQIFFINQAEIPTHASTWTSHLSKREDLATCLEYFGTNFPQTYKFYLFIFLLNNFQLTQTRKKNLDKDTFEL